MSGRLPRECDYISAHEEVIHITTFGEYRDVMKKVMGVIKEAHNVERKRRQTARKKRSDESSRRTQKAKSLIADIRREEMSKAEIERRIEEIFGKGSVQVIWNATRKEKIEERVEELSKREQQFDECERMRTESKRRQREDRRLNSSGGGRPSLASSEAKKRPPIPKKRSTSGGASRTKKRANGGKMTGPSERRSPK